MLPLEESCTIPPSETVSMEMKRMPGLRSRAKYVAEPREAAFSAGSTNANP